MTEKIKAVIDTNIFLGAMFPGNSNPRKIVDALFAGRFIAVMSERTFKELCFLHSKIPVIQEGRSPVSFKKLTSFLKENALWVSIPEKDVKVCDDPDDDKFFATAKAGEADYLVSNDRAVLRIGEYEEIKISNASFFLRKILN